MIDKSNKKFWDKFAKLYAPFMKKDKGVYDKVCEYIRPHLNKDMEVLELACGSGQLSFSLSKPPLICLENGDYLLNDGFFLLPSSGRWLKLYIFPCLFFSEE